jgi:hypothetical protein
LTPFPEKDIYQRIAGGFMRSETAGIYKASVSFRLLTNAWNKDDAVLDKGFDDILELFCRYRGVCDELTFFTSNTHPPIRLETLKKRTDILKGFMGKARAKGFGAGLNILSTVGHHNESLPGSLMGEYTHMTDLDGNICMGSYCPGDEKFRQYVRTSYEYLVMACPDYIWIDDDVRFQGHLPISHGCFCDSCLRLFERETGVKYTRGSLKKAFNEGSADDKIKVRLSWLQHNRDMISNLFRLIEKTVHGLAPDLPLGFMTGDRFFEGYDFDNWTHVLSGPNRVEVRWRPGGGFYSDDRIGDLVGKSHDIGRQVSMLPDEILVIQSEIENFPYQLLKKGPYVTSLEAASHIASGCTGAAFNVLTGIDEPKQEYEPMMKRLADCRPFYDLLARSLGRSRPEGIYTGWTKNSFAGLNLIDGDWLKGNAAEITGSFAAEIFELGLPAAYSPDHAKVTIISGEAVFGMDKKMIMDMLSSGAYMDAGALDALNAMGYGEYTGFITDGYFDKDCMEVMLDHELNRGYCGLERDCRQSFWWREPAAALKKTHKDAVSLSGMIDYLGNEKASCCMGIFENSLGGRICAAGYYPWTFLQNISKASQIRNVMCWLSKYSLPAYIGSYIKMNLWARRLSGGRLGLVLLNSSLENEKNVRLFVRTCAESLKLTDMDCVETIIGSVSCSGGYKEFIIPEIRAWDMRFAVENERGCS